MKNKSIGFLGLLSIVFITLRLCNVITWSWIWVLSPLVLLIIGRLSFYYFIGRFLR